MISRIVVALALIGVWSTAHPTAAQTPAQNIESELARAQSLYYGAQYKETVEKLSEVEKKAASSPEHLDNLIQAKLYLGLSYQAMNLEDEARSKFMEVCKLDPRYTLNPKEFPPKVLTLFESAKASCPPPNQADPSLIQSTFNQGKEFYDQGQFSIASKIFNIVLSLDNKHELAREYAKLADQRLQLSIQQSSVQIYMDWRTSFEAKDFDKAAVAYGKMRSSGSPWITEADAIYERVFSGLASAWKTACAAGDRTKSDTIRSEAGRIDAGVRVRPEIMSQMQQCAPENVAIAGSSSAAPDAAKPLAGPVRPPAEIMKPAPEPVKPTAVPASSAGSASAPPAAVNATNVTGAASVPASGASAPASTTASSAAAPLSSSAAAPSAGAPSVPAAGGGSSSAPTTASAPAVGAAPGPPSATASGAAAPPSGAASRPAPGVASSPAPAAASVPPSGAASCLQVEYPLAMARLKEMVSPRVPASQRLLIPVEVQASVRIDKSGKVTVNSIKSLNPLLNEPVRKALEEWRFIPAVVGETTHCVETEIPITLNP